MTQYYFVTTSLPNLELEEEPEMHLEEFLALCAANLKDKDMKKVRTIQQLIDIVNLAALWRGKAIDKRGALTAAQLEEQEAEPLSTLPSFVFEFLEKYPSTEERIQHHGELVVKYFDETIPTSTGFTHDYLVFERDLRLEMVALRSQQPTSEPALEQIFTGNERNPLELHRQLEFFRFGNIGALAENETFSLDAILGYLVQLMIAERLYELKAA